MTKKYFGAAGLDRLISLIKTVLDAKQDKLTGTQGQVVGFDGEGNAVAQDGVAGSVHISVEKPDKLKVGDLWLKEVE